MRFDNHIAMVMEKGVITLDQYLVEHRGELTMGDYMLIIGSAFNIVKEAHSKRLVLLDLKGSNIMLFDSGRGMRVWKGIDLDGSLLVNSPLGESTFMATVPFMAPELLAATQLAGLQAKPSMDIWSLGILIFNVLVAKQFCNFWTVMGMNSDDDIKEEIRSGRFTQEKVDGNINRNFPGHANSTQRHLLLRMLKVDPSERYTIAALDTAAYLTGVASISTSKLFHNQQHIIGELKSLRDLFQSEFASFRTTLQAVLEEDSGANIGDMSSYLDSLRSLLESQAQSATDIKAVAQSLTTWKTPPDTTVAPGFMSIVTTQLQQLLSAADEQKIDAVKSKELLMQLATDVSGVQEQVNAIREDIAALHGSFAQFGEFVRKELSQNSQKHSLVLERLSAIDAAATSIVQEQTAAKEDAEKTMVGLEQVKQQMIQFGVNVTDIDAKIATQTQLLQSLVQNTHDVPTLMVLVPVMPKGLRKFNPMNLIRDKAKLYFICSYTMQPVACGPDGDGYLVTNLTDFAKKALPLLKVGLVLLQIGLLSTGVPIPLVGLADSAVAQADKLSFLKSAATLLPEKVSLDSVGSSIDSIQAKDEIDRAVQTLEDGNDSEKVRIASKVVAAFLQSQDRFWKFTGVTKKISRSGKVCWIDKRADIVKKFEEDATL
jgi:serine/threonine protein kinase